MSNLPSEVHDIERLMSGAVEKRIFPGAVLWVARQARVVFHKAYGWADLFRRQPMTVDTVFDLASLTKPLATTMALMKLVQQGKVRLDTSLGHWWQPLSSEMQSITVRHLLCHRSGLPPWRPYYLRLRHLAPADRLAALRFQLIREPLHATPGTQTLYSDLGFLMLQWLIEEVVGQRLDRYMMETIYRSLGIEALFFNDLSRSLPPLPYAATELCPWRMKLLSGEVHDDNAYVLGGVAGHAGLFGSAASVGALLQRLLAGVYDCARVAWLTPSLCRTFFQRQTGGTYALGFDTPSPHRSSAGTRFSAQSIGHLGFTGTSFWMDLRKGIVVILLTNRVHPSRYSECIREFRPLLHEAVMTAFPTEDINPSNRCAVD